MGSAKQSLFVSGENPRKHGRLHASSWERVGSRLIVSILLVVATGCSSFLTTTRRYIQYPVKRGDSLVNICARFDVAPSELREINSLPKGRPLMAGSVLRVPYRGQSLQMSRADFEAQRERYAALDKGASRPGVGSTARDIEPIPEPLPVPPRLTPEQRREAMEKLEGGIAFVGRLKWPVKAGRKVISSLFDYRWGNFHEGIDFAVKSGTPIYATHQGKVVYSGSGLRGYGNLVVVRNAAGLVTLYAHNSRNRVRVGDMVKQGSHIADVGSTGKSTGPHLHYETRVITTEGKLKAVDPLAFY